MLLVLHYMVPYMKDIKRILSIFKRQDKLRYIGIKGSPFVFFKNEVNKPIYKKYPGLLQAVTELNSRKGAYSYLVLKTQDLDTVQNLCDTLGILLISKEL